MVLLDALGRRWAMRVLWELRAQALTFRELRASCDEVSPSVLNQRLAELRDLGFVELVDDGYQLTSEGRALEALIAPLDGFAKGWARRLGR